jgi:hypothetical protein
MKAFRIFLISALLAGLLICLAPATTRAADYWNGYWGWYDSTYVPYYQRYYSYGPAYSAPAYSGPAYGYYAPPAYSYGPSYGYGYAPYGGAYYGVPGTGVGVYSAPAAVRAGPLRLGWR